jgi:YegS/Rv2252/BmrU family lipid kinase
MHCKRATLVINPRLGQNLAKITDVLAVLSAAGWQTEVAIKEYGGHSMELANAAAGDRCDLIVAYGGDGTLNQVINGVMNAKKPQSVVGVIPGGTANLWAGDVGIPSDPVQATLALVNSQEHQVDLGYVAVEEITFPDGRCVALKGNKRKLISKARHHFLLMAGLGLDAAVMSQVSQSLKYQVGALAVGLSAAKELPQQRPFPIEVRATSDTHSNDMVWNGHAVQVIVGNTRRYAIVLEMTPEAYIDDGMLDVCVITEGKPLSTMQQISSLILQRKPDNVTSEYFHGAHLSIKVPASISLELDGNFIKLKDYLPKKDYEAIQQTGDLEQVMITYRFDALPQAITLAIPRTYSGELFEHPDQEITHNGHARHHNTVAEEKKLLEAALERSATHRVEHDAPLQSAAQERTAAHVTKSAPLAQTESATHEPDKRETEQNKILPEVVEALLEHGRKVSVVGKAPNPDKKQTYIIAGTSPKPLSGDHQPVAVVVNGKTTIFDRNGQRIAHEAIEQLQAGALIVVEGSKSKRGVIEASRLVI